MLKAGRSGDPPAKALTYEVNYIPASVESRASTRRIGILRKVSVSLPSDSSIVLKFRVDRSLNWRSIASRASRLAYQAGRPIFREGTRRAAFLKSIERLGPVAPLATISSR